LPPNTSANSLDPTAGLPPFIKMGMNARFSRCVVVENGMNPTHRVAGILLATTVIVATFSTALP
jgi:hypothetical protein